MHEERSTVSWMWGGGGDNLEKASFLTWLNVESKWIAVKRFK